MSRRLSASDDRGKIDRRRLTSLSARVTSRAPRNRRVLPHDGSSRRRVASFYGSGVWMARHDERHIRARSSVNY